jgi:hypothetical protein
LGSGYGSRYGTAEFNLISFSCTACSVHFGSYKMGGIDKFRFGKVVSMPEETRPSAGSVIFVLYKWVELKNLAKDMQIRVALSK